MATMLERYIQLKTNLTQKAAEETLTVDELLIFQEGIYRIGVLETCRILGETAPITVETKELCYHYRMLQAYLMSLIYDHKFGNRGNEDQKSKRIMAAGSLQKVVESGQKQFSSFQPTTAELYRKKVKDMLNIILPVWVEYRDTYVDLKERLG